MVMPLGDARRNICALFVALADNGHKNYFSDLSYQDALFASALCSHILIAECKGTPLNEQRLAELVRTSPSTVGRHVTHLKQKQLVIRAPDGLRMNHAALDSATALGSVRSSASLILQAAAALSNLMFALVIAKMIDALQIGPFIA